MNLLNKNWDIVLKDYLESDDFNKLKNNYEKAYEETTVFPLKENIYNAFKLTDYDDVKVVLIGQDPYHGENEANGLCFSVNNDVKIPPSLRNIFKELESDLNIKRENKDLTDWAKQGVFMLNALLTVEKDKPLSHKKFGWENFTDEVIKKLNLSEKPIIFLLWGGYARGKKKLITDKKHFIIESAHPSPLAAYRGFFGSKPFSKINNITKINW